MSQEKIRYLEPEKRKKVILQLLSELTRRRDALEGEIQQLCRLWDETVAELNGGERATVLNSGEASRAQNTESF